MAQRPNAFHSFKPHQTKNFAKYEDPTPLARWLDATLGQFLVSARQSGFRTRGALIRGFGLDFKRELECVTLWWATATFNPARSS
jgi:hypothetical protein